MAAASSAISSSLLSTLSLSGGTCSPCLPSLPAPLSLTFPLRTDMTVKPYLPDYHSCEVGQGGRVRITSRLLVLDAFTPFAQH